MKPLINKLLLMVMMAYIKNRYWMKFIANARKPLEVQGQTLKNILNDNKNTQYGLKRNFSKITSCYDYQKNVEISHYRDIEQLIEQQETTGQAILFNAKALFYARTSGTTGRPKDIPITKKAISQFKVQQYLMSYYHYSECPDAYHGKVLGIVGPAIEGYLDYSSDINKHYGSVSGYLYRSMPWFIRNRYVIPAKVFQIRDYDLKYKVIICLALNETKITHLGAANPSTFIRLRELINTDWDYFSHYLKTGIFNDSDKLPISVQQLLSKNHYDEKRYLQLKHLEKNNIEFKDIWPSIRMVTTWMSGNCDLAIQKLRTTLPEATQIIDLGYIASEFRGTITCDKQNHSGLPLLDHVYYEFIEKHDWQNGQRQTLDISQLKVDQQYYIIITTSYGLYRYFMNDIIEVCDPIENTVQLKFCQKGIGVTSITGEKIYESQVSKAINKCCCKLKLFDNFHMVLANVAEARYEIYLQLDFPLKISLTEIAQCIDFYLAECNLEYSDKRKSGRLHFPQIYLIKKQTSDSYKRYQIELGQREGQYKIITLHYKNKFNFPIANYVT